MKFPYECCQCGFCCLIQTCPIGKSFFGNVTPCPALVLGETKAYCLLACSFVPIGDGCCISAKAYKDGVAYDFAALPPKVKHREARRRVTLCP